MAKNSDFEKLLAQAGQHRMTPAELEAQRRSFAFGNANIDNPNVTREAVDKAAETLKAGCDHCRNHEADPDWQLKKVEAFQAGKSLACAECGKIILGIFGPTVRWSVPEPSRALFYFAQGGSMRS